MKDTTLTRFKAVVLAVLVLSAGSAATVSPAAALGPSSPDLYTSAVLEHSTWSGFEPSEEVVSYGIEGHPGFIIKYAPEDNGSAALQSWINDSSERELISHDTASNWMLVAAPPEDVGVSGSYRVLGQYYSSALAEQSYVERIGINLRVENAEPLTTLADEGSFSPPKHSGIATLSGLRGEFTPSGVAYSADANRTTMQEAREHVSAAPGDTAATGQGVTVAVVDTGVNVNEALYQGRVVAGKNTLTGEEANVSLRADGTANVSASDYSPLADGNLHGSFVTSQIAANSSNDTHDGVAPDAHIIGVKALSDDGSGSTASIARGLDYACGQGADVVSMSLGSYMEQPILLEEISECYEEDGVSAVVIAVGNERTTARWVASPADAQETPVVAVAATNGASPADAESAYFSNVGPDPLAEGANPTVAAPGMRILAQVDTGSGITVRELSGTSMATPVVSGVLVQLLEAQPGLRGEELELQDRLERTASPVPRAGTSEVGAGMINGTQLLSDTEPEEGQEAARTEDAVARDSANEALSGSLVRQLFERELF